MIRQALAGLVLTLLLLPAASAQVRRDPLTPAEIDQLRDTAQEPNERLELYVQFTRAHLEAVAQAESDAHVTDKGQTVHDRLQDFVDLYDELDDNVDAYADRKYDIRKGLKLVVEADTEFQAKLRALKDSATAKPAEAKQYEFVLSDAVDDVDDGAKDHRELMSEQADLAKHKRLIKPDEEPARPH
jgi:hypothetical protein